MNIAANILGEQDTTVAFHTHVLTSPDQAAVVEENLHFISNRTMVTSAPIQATNKMDSRLKTACDVGFSRLEDAEALLR
ncbi:hypothetical protein [Tunturiibacter gelidiferens]|uniref:hypothetical protein n=1 Tax=Tunturiibacter gelidiferens TaxID=3069689 RepID=UPI003D9ACF17